MTKKLQRVAVRNLITVFKHQSGDKATVISLFYTLASV